MEPGHLLHSALTRPSSAKAQRLESRHPFVPATQQLISSSDKNNIRVAQWADHQWNAEWLENITTLHTFIPDTSTHPPEWPSQEESGSSLTASAPMSDVSTSACINGEWPPLRPMSVAQKNKPSTMLSFNIQSIDLPMDCMAWWVLDDETTEWLLNTCPKICYQAVVWTTSSKEEESYRPVVPNLGCICLSEGVHLRFAIEDKNTGCFTIVETKRQLLKPLSMTLFIFLFPDCHREIVNLSIY